MHPLWSLSAWLAVAPLAAAAATLPLFENNGTINGATNIDAVAVVNRGTINATTAAVDGLPFKTRNTSFVTNQSSGVLNGDVGFQFQLYTNNTSTQAVNFVNHGTIVGGTHLIVNATNITNSGSLAVGPNGLVRLTGKSVDLSRSALLAGGGNTSFPRGTGPGSGTFINAPGVTDLYWGSGDNNAMAGGNQTATPLFFFDLPNTRSPLHEVVFAGSLVTSRVSVPFFPGSFGYEAYVWTNQNITVATNQIVQMIFVPSNAVPGLQTSVRFFRPDFLQVNPLAATAIVELGLPDVDLTTGQPLTNYIYLIDRLASLTTNFSTLQTNFVPIPPTFRPGTFEVTRSTPFEYLLSEPANAAYAVSLYRGPGFLSNNVALDYAAYSARVGQSFSFAGAPGTTADPTNSPGRVEINADRLNLDSVRVRADNLISIKTANLLNISNAALDAPLLNLQVLTTNRELNFDTLASNQVRRLSGDLRAYSAIWTNRNTNTGLNIQYHALILDYDLQTLQDVTVGQLHLRGTNVTINDDLAAQLSLLVESQTLTVGGSLAAPATGNIGVGNFPALKFLTNLGVISVPNIASFGTDTPAPYSNIVNQGVISAGTLALRSLAFTNGGGVFANGPLNLQANAFTASNSVFSTVGDITLTARDLLLSNCTVTTSNTLFITATNSLSDGGTNGGGTWTVRNGFRLTTRPPTGDLLGTSLRSTTPAFANVIHQWPGQDRGRSLAGYSNNLALGRLILDGGPASLFTFQPVGASNALYVDFLEFRNAATNFASVLNLPAGMVIYFANANLPVAKLDGALGNRLRWVSDFTGPNSSTTLLYTNAQGLVTSHTFNTALIANPELDSDGDGIPNSIDPQPVYTSDLLVLSTQRGTDAEGPFATITWEALAYSTNTVQFRTNAAAGPWQVLTNFVQGAETGPVSVTDRATGAARFYRVVTRPLQP
jgi:hypothetical protein